MADIEGCYLPGGDIICNSTRCVISVDCMGHPIANLYRLDQDGNFMRRLGFDQVGTSHPCVLPDGRVVFTRWEYNDRNPAFLQPLMQMNPDGTQQVEYYGGNSSWPTSLHHVRPIPGSEKVIAIASGHHTPQAGLLALVDRSKGQERGAGIELLAPRRPLPEQKVDVFPLGNVPIYQYPWPLNANECIAGRASFRHLGEALLDNAPLKLPHFGIYWIHFDGARELLLKRPGVNLFQPLVIARREKPPVIADRVDYAKETGTCFIQDIYVGEGLNGVKRGEATTLRVVELKYRPAEIGLIDNVRYGNVLTPISRNGSWDIKEVIGDADIHEDGSVMLELPARRPFYFQILDARGRLIQTMRSWTVLMPGEAMSCVGCHESQYNVSVSGVDRTIAMQRPPQQPRPFYDVRGGFSFNKHIQPILDKHCVECHKGARWDENAPGKADEEPAFSLLLRSSPPYPGLRKWSDAYLGLVRPRLANLPYLTEEDYANRANSPHQQIKDLPDNIYPLGDLPGDLVNPPNPSGGEAVIPPYARGSGRSRLMTLLEEGHEDVKLSKQELDTFACWIDLGVPFCGDYDEAHAWTPQQQMIYGYYTEKRHRMDALEQANIEALKRQAPSSGM